MLTIIDQERVKKEEEVKQSLLRNIDNNRSFVFNAGAGAGKTYALVECLRYLCDTKQQLLKDNNQEIVCITYTNVAADEMSARLGTSNIVRISTIHEYLWGLISRYQKELIDIHKVHVAGEIERLQSEIADNIQLKNAVQESIDLFASELISDTKKYYEIRELSASAFREALTDNYTFLNVSEIKNVSDFKKGCNYIIKAYNLANCLDSIASHKEGYSEVKYDYRSNVDALHRMKISHDTLIEYATKIIDKYDLLKQIVIDDSPYVFIDEYQDTNALVIKAFTEIEEYSKKIKHPFCLGLFGDNVQNIYSDGVGDKIKEYCSEYAQVNKIYNRRSSNEVIELANRIRNDSIKQESIFVDSQGGQIEFFYGIEDDADAFIQQKSEKFLKEDEFNSDVHCFLLTNKMVAKRVGIEELENWYAKTEYYKKHYQDLNAELLSKDITKLGESQRTIYNIINFVEKIQNNSTILEPFFSQKFLSNMSIRKIRQLLTQFENISGSNFVEIVSSIFEIAVTFDSVHEECFLQQELTSQFDIEKLNVDSLSNKIAEALKVGDNMLELLDDLYSIEWSVFHKWYTYINSEEEDLIKYHTFHSTKGLEFDNVIMVFGDDFGRRQFFNYFWEAYDKGVENEKAMEARNLLYVAVTRARRNLSILYTGDYIKNEQCLKKIFGEMKRWEENNNTILVE